MLRAVSCLDHGKHGRSKDGATLPSNIERNLVAQKQWPTWMVVIAVLILIGPIMWASYIALNLLAAMSIGGILLIVLIVWIFARLNKKVNG
jgi:hypothetical protein